MSPEDKICLPQDLADRLAHLPRPLVMTNGVFDVLHRGHVSYLHRAAELGGSLLVAVNSDRSARMLGKGPDRPLNAAEVRAYVLAGLQSVAMVTFFDTRTPVELIQAVHPDIYVKGGDYDMETLEETRVVRSWGGQSVAIPFVDGFSTTALVQRIRQSQPAQPLLRKAAFLDRDGVINQDRAYVHRWEDFEFVPGAIDGMRRLQQAGYALVIVTNQSGLARGYYSEEQYRELTRALLAELAHQGVQLDGVYHCPHHPKGSVPHLATDCDCRKPAPGMILQAARELGLSLADSILIGDKPSDIEAARAAGVGHAYRVHSDNPESGTDTGAADGHYADLLSCATQLFPAQENLT
jgi:rfaE bifunctional protein nucleotidyltransferase chain/domain